MEVAEGSGEGHCRKEIKKTADRRFFLFKLSSSHVICVSHRRLAYQDDGQYSAQKTCNLGRGPVYVLVNLCIACVERHVVLIHLTLGF